MTNKPILDACCGGRMFWFDKQNPLAVFCDNREFTDTLCDGRVFEVKRDILADFTSLPFEDGAFKLVVFDPPHLTGGGAKSWLVKKYGKLPADWEDTILRGFNECMRVLDDYGILIFKWGEEDISVGQNLKVIRRSPLFGHKSGRMNRTHWMCFMKTPNANEPYWADKSPATEILPKDKRPLCILRVRTSDRRYGDRPRQAIIERWGRQGG
jgi:hypothetical protein